MEAQPTIGFRFRLRSLFLLTAILAVGLLLARLDLLYRAAVYLLAFVVCLPVLLVVVGYCVLSACTLWVLVRRSSQDRREAPA